MHDGVRLPGWRCLRAPSCMWTGDSFPLADRFFMMYRQPQQGGGALVVYLGGEKVLDIWAGNADRDRRWDHDTVFAFLLDRQGRGQHRRSPTGRTRADRLRLSGCSVLARIRSGRQGQDHRPGTDVTSRGPSPRVRGLMPHPLDLMDYDAAVAALAAGEAGSASASRPRLSRCDLRLVGSRTCGQGVRSAVHRRRTSGDSEAPRSRRILVPRTRNRASTDAKLFPHTNPGWLNWAFASTVLSHVGPTRGLAEAAMPAGFDVMVRNPAVHDAVMPGWNGASGGARAREDGRRCR